MMAEVHVREDRIFPSWPNLMRSTASASWRCPGLSLPRGFCGTVAARHGMLGAYSVDKQRHWARKQTCALQ